MSDPDGPEAHASEDPVDDVWARTTAPQSPYTSRQVGLGLLVFGVLAAVAYVLPLVLA